MITYVRLFGLGGKPIFSDDNYDSFPIFSVHIPPIYEHLFCEYFGRQSVGQATTARNVKIKKHDFLGGYLR